MARFIKQEMPDINKDGNKRSYYRMEKEGNISTKRLAHNISQKAGVCLTQALVMHALQEIATELANQLADGYTVKLDGIGTFQASIGLREHMATKQATEVERKHNSTSLELNGVRFRADKELIKKANKECVLHRGEECHINGSPYTMQERLQMAQEYLANPETPCMNVRDYAFLTQMPLSSAARELRTFLKTPGTRLMRIGLRNHIVYALQKKNNKE